MVREGGTLRLSEGRWKVAMAEPVLQGAVVKGQTRVIVLPPSGEEGDDDIDSASKQAETQPHQERARITSHSSEEDDSQDDEDFEIDESFLVNSVLTPSHHQRFGQTPLTSPLSTSSKQRQFFPLGELSASSATLSQPQNRLVAVPLQHPIPSDLLTPTPDQEEDDVPRAFLSTADLGRAGLFSGDWAVLRKDEPEAGAARLVKVFAGDGLVESGESTTQGYVTLLCCSSPFAHSFLRSARYMFIFLRRCCTIFSVLRQPIPQSSRSNPLLVSRRFFHHLFRQPLPSLLPGSPLLTASTSFTSLSSSKASKTTSNIEEESSTKAMSSRLVSKREEYDILRVAKEKRNRTSSSQCLLFIYASKAIAHALPLFADYRHRHRPRLQSFTSW